ncbi:glutamate-cysteine ligase family protein [Streptomyces actinomycinicus]
MSRNRVGRVGVELEWFVLPLADPARRADGRELACFTSLLREPLPHGSRISWEPGGQVELSGAPQDSLARCVDAVAADVAVLRSRALAAGLHLLGAGLDGRAPRFTVPLPRYQALRRYYARHGQSGDTLLCNTASVQVNVEAGDGSDGWRGRYRRWLITNALGPVLMAMFANSPVPGAPDGQGTVLSGRQSLRFGTDPFRTGPLPLGGDPRGTWTRFALDAKVVAVRRCGQAPPAPPDGAARTGAAPDPTAGTDPDADPGAVWEPAPSGLSLRQWLRGAGPRAVRSADVFLHLKSLVPPVRACGHLELRMIDAQDGDDWIVPVAVVAALLDDEGTSDAAASLVRAHRLHPTRQYWIDAARRGLGDPELAALVRTVMDLALPGLRRLGVSPGLYGAVARFAEHHTARGRAPAHARRAAFLRPPVPEGVTGS